MISVSIVIPTLNAGNIIGSLLDSLEAQSLAPVEIIIIDSSSDDETVQIAKQYGARVIVIPRKEFDHGGTRHKAFLASTSNFVLFMTQDAMPANQHYIENLIAPFSDPRVAMVSGRQIPRHDARRFEQLVRQYNYRKDSFVIDKSDIERLGIKAFFVSDVCSAYRREAYLSCGGFARPCNTNEDMLIAANFLRHDYRIAYVGNAQVIHSHSLSLREEYARNRQIGFFLETHQEELFGASALGEGRRMVLAISGKLLKENKVAELFAFYADCAARLLGSYRGKFAASSTN